MGSSRSGRFYIIIAVVTGIVAFVIGILIGRFAACDESDSGTPTGKFDRIIQEADPKISTSLIEEIKAENIANNLRDLTEKPHIAGQERDFELVTYLKTKLTGYGLDSVSAAPYEVLLSYPNHTDPNRAELLDVAGGEVLFDSRDAESNISHLEGVVRPFLAYSPAAEIEGDLVYVNYGRVEDYTYLEKNISVNITGKIVIARYGKIFRGSKVDIAARHGAIGIIIYSDPADYTDPDDPRVFPETVWLPGTAAQRGTIYTGDGDPLTPGYPAIRTAYRMENETGTLPTIPAHCIGYTAAEQFLRKLNGPQAPELWRGRISNLTYRIGPLSNNTRVRLTTTTYNSRRKADTVVGIIKGAVEPDRYVLMGNHRDAWVYGSIDPSSGTAVMMEVARAMAKMAREGTWRPRRSIMFCSWGAEEYGLLGSTEIAEQYIKSLGPRAVAYANIDIAVQGNYSLRALGTPLLYTPIFEAAKKVPNPNPEEIAAGRSTVYDTWRHSFPWDGQDLPKVGALGSGSDYAPMIQIVGITSVDFRYTYDSNTYKLGSYPLYHTEYETFDTMQNLLDREFKYHRAVAQVGVEVLRALGDSLIIPFNVSDYAWGLDTMRRQLDEDQGDLLRDHLGEEYDELQKAVQSFTKDVETFERAVVNMDKTDPMAIRMINDQLLLLEKSFLDPAGLPTRPLKKHLLFAENSNDVYAGSSFPGLVDLLFEIQDLPEPEQSDRWQRVRHHFSVLLNAIQAAGFTLRDVVRFVEETY